MEINYKQMKKIFTCIILILVIGCSPDEFSDCLSTSGEKFSESISISAFEKVIIGRNIAVFIEPALTYEMEVVANQDHIKNFRWRVEGNETLHLEAVSLCSAGFSEAPIEVTLYTPNLTEIVNGTQFMVASKSPLTFSEVNLIADQNHNAASLSTGLFDLEFDNEKVFYRSSNILKSNFSGKTKTFGILKTGGLGEISAFELEANNVNIFHRGFNEISVFPLEVINAQVRSTGNLVAHNTPSTIYVEAFFTGKFILLNP